MIITEKISLDLPVLYDALIFDDYVEKKKYQNRTEFIIQAIKDKFDKDGIRHEARSNKTYKTVEEIPLIEE